MKTASCLALLILILLMDGDSLAMSISAQTPRSASLDDADPNATHDLIAHDVGNVRATLSNYGEYGNPNGVSGFYGMEFPINSGNRFLFSAGIWVGAVVNGQMLVSTTTDGDNGTGEFWPVHIGTIPETNTSDPDWYISSCAFAERNGKFFVRGVMERDDDGDWNLETDDLDGDLLPSGNWDGGNGLLFFDDDGDGLIDEESPDGIDNDGDGRIDEARTAKVMPMATATKATIRSRMSRASVRSNRWPIRKRPSTVP